MMTKKYNIAIVGVTGLVGRTFIKVLEEVNFPIKELRLLASMRSRGVKIKAFNREIVVEALDNNSFEGIDIAFFSAGGDISLEYGPVAVASGALVIDNSSAWRMDEGVPLVVPEVNPEDIKLQGIIANPNCSTIQSVLPLKAIDLAFGVEEVNYTTYQSVSGSGQKGLDDYQRTIENQEHSFYPYNIAKTCIPQIDEFLDNGYTKEEMKMVLETKKILHKDIPISATCVRVPVESGHGVSIALKTRDEFDINSVRKVLERFPGIVVVDDYNNLQYPVSTLAKDNDYVYVGRIRRDLRANKGLLLYCVADNIRKGAASNAIGIARKVIEKVEK